MNSIIKEIHSEFSKAEETLLRDAKQHLKKAAEADKKQINALAGLGFSNFKEARDISPEEIARVEKLQSQVKQYNSLTNIYKFITDDKVVEICQKYGLVHGAVGLYTDSIPTKNQQEIVQFNEWAAKQKDLLTEPVIPEHNWTWQNVDISSMSVSHILNAISWIEFNWDRIIRADTNIKDVNSVLSSVLIEQYVGIYTCFLNELFKRNIINKNSFLMNRNTVEEIVCRCTNEQMQEMRQARVQMHSVVEMPYFHHVLGSRDTQVYQFSPDCLSGGFFILRDSIERFQGLVNPKPEYTIVAAKHMMDLSNHDVNDKYKVIQKVQNLNPELAPERFFRDDDPIVLYRVNGGYFIVSAWGDEASDENIVNHQMN